MGFQAFTFGIYFTIFGIILSRIYAFALMFSFWVYWQILSRWGPVFGPLSRIIGEEICHGGALLIYSFMGWVRTPKKPDGVIPMSPENCAAPLLNSSAPRAGGVTENYGSTCLVRTRLMRHRPRDKVLTPSVPNRQKVDIRRWLQPAAPTAVAGHGRAVQGPPT